MPVAQTVPASMAAIKLLSIQAQALPSPLSTDRRCLASPTHFLCLKYDIDPVIKQDMEMLTQPATAAYRA